MIGHHFSISAFWSAASASGVCWARGNISSPWSVSFWRNVESINVLTTALLSLASTFFGVFLAYGFVGPMASRLKSAYDEEALFYHVIRDVLVARQRRMGEPGGVVMEGRDIGTVVFPDADVKIYLDASAEERARRRLNDPAHSGGKAGEAAVAASIEARDRSDSTRAASPLTLAPDAVLIDTTGMPIARVVDKVLALVNRKLAS